MATNRVGVECFIGSPSLNDAFNPITMYLSCKSTVAGASLGVKVTPVNDQKKAIPRDANNTPAHRVSVRGAAIFERTLLVAGSVTSNSSFTRND